MLAEEYNRMLFERMHSDRRWETEPAIGWAVQDLDLAELRNTVAEAVRVGRLNEPQSRAGGLAARFGADARRWAFARRSRPIRECATARVRDAAMASFALGVSAVSTDRSSSTTASSWATPSRCSRVPSAYLTDTIPIASCFEPGRVQRIDEPLYPPLAVREAVANTLCHRDYAMGGGSVGLAVYDDRLEVKSTGPLHFGLTPDDLFAPHESRPWNPLVARTFYRRGVIEQWGRGTLRMAQLATAAGLPRPEIEECADSVTVRFRRSDHHAVRRADDDLTDQQNAVLEVLRGSGRALALREIRALLGADTNERRLREDLATLKAKGLADSAGRGAGARWKPL